MFSLLMASPQGRQGDPGPQGIDGARVSQILWTIFLSFCLNYLAHHNVFSSFFFSFQYDQCTHFSTLKTYMK